MKIGINARFLMHPYTGIGKYTAGLLKGLAQAENQNEYFLLTPEPTEVNLPPNFHQIRLPEKSSLSPSLAKAHWEHTLVPQELEKLNVDLAHFLYPSNPTRKLPFPTIVTIHDVIPWVLPDYRHRLRSRLYHAYVAQAIRKADHLLAVSEFSAQEAQKTLSIEGIPVKVTHEGSSARPDFLPEDIPLRRPFLLYVGGYDPRKNVPVLMEAYQKYLASHHALDLVLVGGAGRGLERFLTDRHYPKVDGKHTLPPKGEIVFTPPLSEEELALMYAQATAFVHPSLYEGFNLPVLEALSWGLPMVISDIPVNREVAGEAAFFADPSTPDTFGLGLHEFIHNKPLQAQLKGQAKDRAADFSWEKCARQTLEVYGLFLKG